MSERVKKAAFVIWTLFGCLLTALLCLLPVVWTFQLLKEPKP